MSGNFHWSTSLLDLAGRAGLDLNFSLSYNSLATWTKTENWSGEVAYSFDADRGSPAPGFRLGFPSIQGPFFNNQAQTAAYLMIAPSGARVELRQSGVSNVYESVDSSSLQLLDGGNGSMLLRAADGMQMSYWSINNEYRCTEIKDRNGNFITIRYDAINGSANLGRMTAIIDTLGREIDFNYDGNFRLQSITQMRNGQAHSWVTFGYASLKVETNFEYPCGLADAIGRDGSCEHIPEQGLPANGTIAVLTQVGLDDGSRYLFDYTTWGQVYEIRHRAADTHDLSYTAYNLPLDDERAQAECPRFTQRQDWVEDWNNNEPAETTFEFNRDENWGQVTVAQGTTDQTSYREYSRLDYTDWTRGLVTLSEIRDHTGTVKKTTVTAWERDRTGLPYALNPRPKRVTISDAEGNRRQTSFEYTSFGLLSEVFEQGPLNTSDWAILRRTHTDYDLSPAYVNRHILGLVQGQYLFAPDAPNSPSVQILMSKTTHEYDMETGICNTPGLCADYAAAANNPLIVQHDPTNYGPDFMVGRGALTYVHRWDASDETNQEQRLTSRIHYNSLGSPIRSSDPLGRQTTIGYADQFSIDGTNVGNPSTPTMAYPTTVTDPDSFSSHALYNYELGRVTREEDPKGAAEITQYDAAGRVTHVTNSVNDAFSATIYPSNQKIIINKATIKDLGTPNLAYSFTVFDGAGRIRATASDFPDSTLFYRGMFTLYDRLGRSVQKSNPTEMSNTWATFGGDDAGWYFTTQTYDWKDRPLVTTNADLSTKTASYGGCGCAGGESITVIDEAEHQRRLISDTLGRPWKAVIFKEDGSTYSTTTTTYNERDQVLLARQYEGIESSTSFQDTTMTYDGYGRLSTKHVPEQNAGLATTYAYRQDGAVQTIADARGAITTYDYNNRQLVTGVTYGGGYSGPNATFEYDAAGNRTWMIQSGGQSVEYDYDQLSRLNFENHAFNGMSNSNSADGKFKLSYEYNVAGQLEKITDPFGSVVTYTHNKTGDLTDVEGSGGLQYASGMKYRAWRGLKHRTYGNNLNLDVGYNVRLQTSQYDLVQAGSGTRVMGQQYRYTRTTTSTDNDGRLKYSHDLGNSNLDRTYFYDQTGRLAAGVAGTQQNDGHSNFFSGPFEQNYYYDVWGNLNRQQWRTFETISFPGGSFRTAVQHLYQDTVVNGRNTAAGWQYDADGGLLTSITDNITRHYAYDATGAMVSASEPNITLQQYFDGDGQRVKYVENGDGTYYLRSTALGGQVVTELNQSGEKRRGYVYQDGETLAKQEGSATLWDHRDPSGASTRLTDLGGNVTSKVEMDPLGTKVNDTALYNYTGGTGYVASPAGFYGNSNQARDCVASGFGVAVPCGYLNPRQLGYKFGIIDTSKWVSKSHLKTKLNISHVSSTVQAEGEIKPLNLFDGDVNFNFSVSRVETTTFQLSFAFFNPQNPPPVPRPGPSPTPGGSHPTDQCYNPDNWNRKLTDFRTIADAIGWNITDTGAPGNSQKLSFSESVANLKKIGFEKFTNLNRAHWGGYDYQGTVNNRWYHITMYPKQTFAGASAFGTFYKDDYNKTPKRIEIHCEKWYYKPSSAAHFFDYIFTW